MIQYATATKQTATPFSGRPAFSARLAVSVLAVSALILWPTTLHAIDLGQDGNLRTSTAGLREWLKRNSDVKKYGAERVVERDRTPFQPDGIALGTFLFLPSVGVTGMFDDNIYATDKNRVSDYRTEITPEIRLRSRLPRHVLDVTAGARIVNHLRHEELDFIDGFARVDSALHFDSAHTLSFSAVSALLHEERAAPFAPANAREPVGTWHNKVKFGLTRDAGQLYGTFTAYAESWDFRDVTAFNGDTIDQDNRDTAVFGTQLRMGYRFSPGFELIGKLLVERRLQRSDTTVDRHSVDYEGAVGLAFQTSPLLRFSLLAGYGYREFDDASQENVGSWVAQGAMEWLPTQLLTVKASVRREIGDAVSGDGVGFIGTEVSAGFKYEIWRNLLLTTGGSYYSQEFTADDRADKTYSGTVGLEYLHTKFWAFNISYEHKSRFSNLDEFNLRRNKIRLGAKLRF